MCFKFGTDIEVGPLLRMNHKVGVAWVTWPVSKFWDPLITFEQIVISALNLAHTQMTDPYCVRTTKRPPKWAWPRSRDQMSKIWDPHNFWTNRDIRFKFDTDINDGPLLHPDHKTTLSGRGLGHVALLGIVGPTTTVKTANVNYMYINNSKQKAKLKKVYKGA